ncbi:MAG: hypothetical protein IT436_10820 [Phycisphaerales bacterium]|nr:hypothetical protein [Phycisphaerales bacterium]
MHIQGVRAAALVAGLAASASASVTYTSQNRSAYARGGQPPVSSEPIVAAGFGPFDAEAYAVFPNPGWADSWGRAIQHSTLDESGIVFTGFCEGLDGYGAGGSGVGAGISTLDVTFTVSGSAGLTWQLDGMYDPSGREPSGLLIELTRASTIPETLFIYRGYDPISASGALPDGEYRFRTNASGGWSGVGTGQASLGYDIRLGIVPGPGPLVMAAVTGPLFAAQRRRARS